jgi:hypothetical protein
MYDYEITNGKVYCRGSIMKKADAASFQQLNELYSCDNSHVFVLGSILKQADPSTFKVYKPYITWHKNGKADYFTGSGYASDSSHVFYYEYTVGNGFVVKGADVGSFDVLNYEFAKDSRSVFFMGRKVKGAKPESTIILSQGYCISNSQVFYGNNVVPEAHAESFEVAKDSLGLGILGKDHSNHYDAGMVVSIEDFNKQVADNQ